MINLKTISDFNCNTDEGKLLLSAIAILTSIESKDIKSGIWGGMTHPDTALQQIQELANKIYYEREWEAHQRSIERDKKIIQALSNDKS